jgi:Raf kinase inhibitor-like YbhB/YbcL family protein
VLRHPPTEEQQNMKTRTIALESGAFADGDPIPRRYSKLGEDRSPALSWSGLPPGTQELALIVDDPDAPRAEPWVHWLAYRIPASLTHLPEGVARRASELEQGRNSFGDLGYGGPRPPSGHGIHHYHFKLYALDAPLSLGEGADKAQLLAAMEGHILAQGELIGTYQVP